MAVEARLDRIENLAESRRGLRRRIILTAVRHRRSHGCSSPEEAKVSRYAIPAKEPHFTIAVGWDNALETFFGIVYDTRLDEDHRICLWVGARLREVASVPDPAEFVGMA